MDLNETQIDNLVSFYFNINNKMDSPLLSQDYSYIMEKWGKWISRDVTIENFNPNIIPTNELTKTWIRRWCNLPTESDKNNDDMFLGTSDNILNQFINNPENHIIVSVVKFISVYESTDSFFSITHLISFFENCFPNIEINKTKGGVLHPLIEQHIDQYMNYEGNVKLKKIYLRESYVNLLTD